MKLLFIAYKIEKEKGSEDGTGYHVSQLLAQKIPDLTIITRQNNLQKLQADPHFKHVRLIGIELPWFLSFYKKGSRGIILYYYLWQIFTGYRIFKLQLKEKFDVIHQFNFHASWAPHFIFSKAKIIWGPLTQHPDFPLQFWEESKASLTIEIIRRLIKKYFLYLDPFVKWSINRSTKIIFGNTDVKGSYKKTAQEIQFSPQARSSFPIQKHKNKNDHFNLLYIGRFISLKGSFIALKAFGKMIDHLPKKQQHQISFTLIGEGPLLNKLQILADQIMQRSFAKIIILPWLPQPYLLKYYQDANLFLFPSFEAQGLVVAEALANGCPVLCLDKTGPAIVGGDAAIIVSVEQLPLKLLSLVNEYYNAPEIYMRYIDKSIQRAHDLTWENMVNQLMAIYHE